MNRSPAKRIYIKSLNKNQYSPPGTHKGWTMEKRVLVKINRDKTELTLREVLDKIKELQDKNPDLDVFFDGDQFAICARSRKASE